MKDNTMNTILQRNSKVTEIESIVVSTFLPTTVNYVKIIGYTPSSYLCIICKSYIKLLIYLKFIYLVTIKRIVILNGFTYRYIITNLFQTVSVYYLMMCT